MNTKYWLWGLSCLCGLFGAPAVDAAEWIYLSEKPDLIEPLPQPWQDNLLRAENWGPGHISLEVLIHKYASIDALYSINSDWSAGLGYSFTGATGYLHHLNLLGRYYLPNQLLQDFPQLDMSRLFVEGRGRLGFSRPVANDPGDPNDPSWVLESALGLESRWRHLVTHLAIGADLTQTATRLTPGPFVRGMIGLEFPINTFQVSDNYEAAQLQMAQRSLSPALQIQTGGSLFEGTSISVLALYEHWGLGFYTGETLPILNHQDIGLKLRYYPELLHPGPQFFLEGVSNLSTHTGILARAGFEHRELWGAVLGIAVGIGLQRPVILANSIGDAPNSRFQSFVAPTFDFAVSLGYAWSFADLNKH